MRCCDLTRETAFENWLDAYIFPGFILLSISLSTVFYTGSSVRTSIKLFLFFKTSSTFLGTKSIGIFFTTSCFLPVYYTILGCLTARLACVFPLFTLLFFCAASVDDCAASYACKLFNYALKTAKSESIILWIP
jgi:hypothetical protein